MVDCVVNDISTFLSPPVQRLLVDSREDHLTSSYNGSGSVTSHLTFNWDVVSTNFDTLLEFSDHDGDQQRYRQVCEELWPLIKECGRKVQECVSIPVHLLEWTSSIGDIQHCFTQMQKKKCSIIPLKISLHLSSILEHSLGNMLVARALLGSPLGFNLRNICWHGFPAPEEICMSLAAALLVLITSFGELLSIADISSIPCRLKIGKNTWACYLPTFESLDFPKLKHNCSEVTAILENVDSIPSTHQSYWTSSFNFLCTGSNGECLLLLLPALEHTLRCAYCSVNECPQRMLVAEQHVLYTTMDEILDQYFMKSESVKTENRLPSLLGNKLMEMLLDMFSSFGGPRIRDKLSHGECILEEIPAIVANHLFCISLLVLLKLGHTTSIDLSTSLFKMEEEYIAKFHSISLLKYEAFTVTDQLKAFHIYFKPDLISSEVLNFQTSLCAQVLKFPNCHQSSDIDSLIESCLKQPVITLFRNKSDLGHISTLRKIVTAVHEACKNCLGALENRQNCLNQHALRSRQRTSFFRMLDFMPSFQVVVKCLVLTVLFQLLILPHMIVNSKFIKSMQQYADNMSSLSCSEKNRWTEMQEKTTCFCLHSVHLLDKTLETNLLQAETLRNLTNQEEQLATVD
ncbi:endoplasmic reticulum membrane-associated RNA degradation protein-like isoform X2 [Thrips palmi]|uniref:Endoplasmic reticulum membrane-associated RNA degradation protein-like isoform X2 n=1 Tax=Thrips palmi TaxID=161013 RepID=A0A6P8YVD4_THRPL|nr:endoplasmic reticulum membrane-associated RNA degradation protein-like isoform X2 [Thrips palmi]